MAAKSQEIQFRIFMSIRSLCSLKINIHIKDTVKTSASPLENVDTVTLKTQLIFIFQSQKTHGHVTCTNE